MVYHNYYSLPGHILYDYYYSIDLNFRVPDCTINCTVIQCSLVASRLLAMVHGQLYKRRPFCSTFFSWKCHRSEFPELDVKTWL